MKIAKIQFVPWDKAYFFSVGELKIAVKDEIVVETELGMEIGNVIDIKEMDEKELAREIKGDKEQDGKEPSLKPILRKANPDDLARKISRKEREDALEFAKEMKERFELQMKFVDVHYSLDRSRITFAFIADGRVDFRNLVKELTRHFGCNIRLQQIGIRDEAKISGDCGHCGRPLCCRGFLRDLSSITSEMADLQQCAHRGSERLSGACGRLMCCLAYENEGYECLAKKMPPIGTKVNVDGKRGTIVGHQTLKQCVRVEFPSDGEHGRMTVEVDLNRKKK